MLGAREFPSKKAPRAWRKNVDLTQVSTESHDNNNPSFDDHRQLQKWLIGELAPAAAVSLLGAIVVVTVVVVVTVAVAVAVVVDAGAATRAMRRSGSP